MSDSDKILDKFEHGKIITFEDKHILEYKDDEDDCDELNSKIRQREIKKKPENNNKNDFENNKCQSQFKFKRSKIQVIKKNLRKETNIEPTSYEQSSNNELTNFNSNLLTNNNNIFDDTDIFYNRLKIQKKRKISQNFKNEFALYSNNSQFNPKTEESPNNESNVYLSLETEFCRKIDNNSINIKNDPIINQINSKVEIESTYKNTLIEDHSIESQNNILKQEDLTDKHFKTLLDEKTITNTESNTCKQQSNLDNNLLYEEPLDFGISSTLALLKRRGEISSPRKKDSKLLNNNENIQEFKKIPNSEIFSSSELDNQISIFHTDDNGSILNPKEAFKRLCWKFHGQKINKNKLEKMLRNHLRNKI